MNEMSFQEIEDFLKKKKAKRQKAYREANREKIAKRQRAHRKANKKKIAKRQKAYYEKNREVIKKKRRDRWAWQKAKKA